MRKFPELEGKVVVVVGGTGTVGSGAVYRFLESGAQVVVPARSEKSEQALQTDLEGLTHTGRLDVVRCSVGDEASCDVFRDHVKEKYGGVDHVVSSLGGWCELTPLSQHTLTTFRTTQTDRVEGHFIAYTRLFPLLNSGGTYTFVTGGLSAVCPAPGMSLMTVSSAGVVGLVKAAMAEAKGTEKGVNELRISFPIRRHTDSTIVGATASTDVGKVCTMIASSGYSGMELRITSPADLDGFV